MQKLRQVEIKIHGSPRPVINTLAADIHDKNQIPENEQLDYLFSTLRDNENREDYKKRLALEIALEFGTFEVFERLCAISNLKSILTNNSNILHSILHSMSNEDYVKNYIDAARVQLSHTQFTILLHQPNTANEKPIQNLMNRLGRMFIVEPFMTPEDMEYSKRIKKKSGIF
jgi:hypothetical protein